MKKPPLTSACSAQVPLLTPLRCIPTFRCMSKGVAVALTEGVANVDA
jgi:hypothetical protein